MSEVAEAIRQTLLEITEKRRKEVIEKGDILEAILASIAKGLLSNQKSAEG